MADDNSERWALKKSGGGVRVILNNEVTSNIDEVLVEKSFAAATTKAAYIRTENSGSVHMWHLTADDAEGIGTVLLYLADKWRKENP